MGCRAYLDQCVNDIHVSEDVSFENPLECVHGLALEGADAGDPRAANHGTERLWDLIFPWIV